MKESFVFRSPMALVMMCLCLAVSAFAQGNLGGVTGIVSDASGAGVPDVTIKVISTATGRVSEAISGQGGTYTVPALIPGAYRIEAEKAGFRKTIVENVTVQTATVGTVDVTLQIGNIVESVTVNSANLELQTTNAEIGTTVETKALLDLPISLGGAAMTGASGRRQIENFLFLTPGVTGNQWNKSINGAPAFSSEVLIDGLDMQNLGAPGFIADSAPPYEAISEFKVQNTLYPAEFGLGYGVENFTMKSGTNEFHGDLFELLRNDKFDARGFFNSSKPPLRQNEFGGTIGGPVILPGYHNRSRTHFFFAYSGFRLRGGLPQGNLVSIPTMQERTGDFSDYPYPIFDPGTTRSDGKGGFVRDPFVGNIIPQGRLSQVAQRLAALIPPPDIPGAYFNNYVDRSNQPADEDDWSVKIDHQLTSKQQITGSFWWAKADLTVNGALAGPLNPGFRQTPTRGGGLRLNHVYSISPTVLNHLGFGYTPTKPTWTYWLKDSRKGNETLQIPGIPADANGYPEFYFDNPAYSSLGNAQENGFDPQNYRNWTINEDLNWTKGKQTLKFGFQYRYRSNKAADLDNRAGLFYVTSLGTSQPNDPNYSIFGNSFASLMLGQIDSSSRQQSAPTQLFRDSLFSWYVDDNFRLTKRFTLSLGLRYELPRYIEEEQGRTSVLDLARPNPGAGGRPGALKFQGDGTGRTGTSNIFGEYHMAFAPRLGLTYALNERTVIRAGYGIFRLYPNYGRINSGIFWNSGFGATLAVASTNSGIAPAFNLDQGFPLADLNLPNFDPAQNNNGSATYVNSKANRPAFMQSWTLDIQRQLPYGMMLDTAYVASRTTGTWTGLENINQVDPKYLSLGGTLRSDINSPEAAAAGIGSPYPGFSGSVGQALRPYPQYTTIWDMFQPTGYSTYHSLQLRLQKNLSNGLSFLTSYTLSKNIGVQGSDTFGDPFGGGGATALDTFNRKLDKAILGIDQTHVFVLSWNYEVPIGRGKRFGSNLNPVVNAVIGGWQLNSIERYQSGVPIAVSGGGNIPLFGGGNRPNWISDKVRTDMSMSDFDPAKDLYLNINAFGEPAPFTFGNAPKRLPNVRRPALYNEDFSLFKKFGLGHESRFLEFRAEFFNVLNRVVFGGPATNVNSPSTFGTIGSQGNEPRVVQFALKLLF
jgi:hypothetical protein